MLNELLGTAWALPIGGLVFATVGLLWIWIESRRLDRKYGKER